MSESFIVSEQKCLVPPDRTAERASKHIAPKRRNTAMIEKIPRIQCAVAQEFVNVAVEFIAPRGGHNVDLCPWPLAVFRAISVLHYRKLAHRIHAQKLSAFSSRRVIDLRRTRKLNSIQQIKIFLRPVS